MRIHRSFEKIGMPLRKTKVMEWNKVFCHVPEQYRSHFIRGLFDGDGCIYVGNHPKSGTRLMINFVSASSNFIYPMMEFIKTVTTTKSIVRIDKNGYYHIDLSYKKAEELCNYFYEKSEDMRLCRKYDKYIKYIYR